MYNENYPPPQLRKSEYLLSICIPTYNRCDILNESLSILFANPDFDSSLIEVLVSDNCSTDNTPEIVKKYPLVQYYKTEKNIVDANFTFVLEKANGLYIRLFNDTLRFNNGMLKKMLHIIQSQKNKQENLFFFNNIFLNKNCTKSISNKNELLNAVSFYTTWIGNFGCWKNDFLFISDKNKYVKTQFLQVDWIYRLVENKKRSNIYFYDWVYAKDIRKGGYNIFNTFVNKYLYLIKVIGFPLYLYKIEKFRLFYEFILYFYKSLYILKGRYTFETKNGSWIILKKYWYEPYFILLPLTLLYKFIIAIKNRIKNKKIL